MGRSGRPLDKLPCELFQVPFPPHNCKICGYVFEYTEDTPLNHVIQLLYGHHRICFPVPRDLHRKEVTDVNEKAQIAIAHTPSTQIKRTRITPQVPLEPLKRRKKNVMDEKARRQLIERDTWGKNATSKSVECRGCGKTIKLDKRSQYYPGLWHKHRNKCPEIRRFEAQTKKATNSFPETSVGNKQSLTRESSPLSSGGSSETSTAWERVLQWTTTIGPRYEAPPTRIDTRKIQTREQSDDNDKILHTKRPVYGMNSTITTTTSARVQDSDEESHREQTSLEPLEDNPDVTQSPEGPEQQQRVNGCSTRRDPFHIHKGEFHADKKELNLSEDVIQAALCLVSMKSRVLS